MRKIGIDAASADVIRKRKLSEAASQLFVPLLAHAEAAMEFLRENPHASTSRHKTTTRSRSFCGALIRLRSRSASRFFKMSNFLCLSWPN